jgi:hypothetical protein
VLILRVPKYRVLKIVCGLKEGGIKRRVESMVKGGAL